MLGPLVNSAALLVGGALGAALSHRIPKRVRDALPLTCGIISVAIGVTMVTKVHTIPAVTLAMLCGAFIGEVLFLEHGLGKFVSWVQLSVQRFVPLGNQDPHAQNFILKYITILVLFSVSGMGIFGAMHEGMSGDTNILLTKSVLDFFTAIIFAAELGFSVMLIAIPQFIIQGALFFGAGLLVPLMNPGMQADFSACGGIIMLATGLRICGIKIFPIVNMLPALLLIMPISALWGHFAG
jgi:uncharacterized protein